MDVFVYLRIGSSGHPHEWLAFSNRDQAVQYGTQKHGDPWLDDALGLEWITPGVSHAYVFECNTNRSSRALSELIHDCKEDQHALSD